MSLRGDYQDRVEGIEESLDRSFSYRNAVDLKIFLDNMLPFIFMLLTFVIIFEFFFPVNATMAMWIQWANWTVIIYFALRLGVEFKLSGSRHSFFRQHWFDMLLVIPAFSVLKEARAARLFSLGDDALVGSSAVRNTGAAARLTRIARVVKRSA